MSSLRKNVGQSNPTRESWPIIFDVAQELFTVCYKWHPDAIVAHPHLQLYWVVEYVSRRWSGPRSRVGAVEASVYGPRVWLFRNRAARYSRFDSGDFASETVKVSAKLPWWQPSIVNRKETLNEELVAEDETETSWWVWSCDKCVVWFDFFFFTVPSFDFWARILCVN